MAPRWGFCALVVLATIAAIIASQALDLRGLLVDRAGDPAGYSPRLESVHVAHHQGQIYIPQVNWTLMFARSDWFSDSGRRARWRRLTESPSL
jgi:KUP system potassium uptake protein